MNSPLSSAAGQPVAAAAPALLERHGAALRSYLGHLPGADAPRVERVIQEVLRSLGTGGVIDDDPAVWLFARARQQMMGGGQRGEVLLAGDVAGADDAIETEDSGVAVHRAFARLTGKQQEALRLKFQFGFNGEELARITGLSLGGAAGLLQHALGRVVQAMPVETGLQPVQITDPRLMAYALDELLPAERKAFVEGHADGKKLLQTTEVVRRAARLLTQTLESGAPPPRRRRRKRSALPWWLAGAAMVLVAGGIIWWCTRPVAVSPAGHARGQVATKGAFSTKTAGRGAASPTQDEAARPGRKRELRPGQAEWETKAFGRGTAQGTVSDGEVGGVDTSASGGGREAAVTTVAAVTAEGAAAPGQYPADDPSDGPSRAEEEETVAVMAPAGGGGGEGAAAGGGVSAVAPSSPGAAGGPTAVQDKVVFNGKVTDDASRKQPEDGMAPPLRGLADVKHQLARGEWPRPGQVRIAALLRRVPPERAAPGGPVDPVAVSAEIAPSPFTPGKFVVRVTVRAKPSPPVLRTPANLVLAIDVSESMKHPNRLPLVQEGVRLLAERLRPDDRVAVISYAAEAREVRASAPIGEGGRELRDSLDGLTAGGRTNGYEGLVLAYAAARRARSATGLNTVILCTDGNFNLGETGEAALAGLAAQAAADGIKLCVFGFGRTDRNDLRLELLAQQGGGRSCYVNTREEAERLLAGQIDGLFEPVAWDVAWRVRFNPERASDVKFLGGQIGEPTPELLPGRTLAALYEIGLTPGGTGAWAEARVDYRVAGGTAAGRVLTALTASATDVTQTSPAFRFAVAMVELGRILQGERGTVGFALDRLEEWATANLPDDRGGYRRDLLGTIAAARRAGGR